MTSTTSPTPTLRLFTALWPSPPVRAALAGLRDHWHWPEGAAPVDAARLHATLHFIGSVPAARLPDIASGLAVTMPAAEIPLDEARPKMWPGGIAVLEFAVPQALRALHARLAQALDTLGLPVEQRPWRPHVTLARKARGAEPPADVAATLPRWRVDGYALVRTVPGRGYETLQHYEAMAEPWQR